MSVAVGGTVLERDLPTRFVHAWSSSPFVGINRTRLALVGRDLLRAFGLRLRLSAPEAATSIEGDE